MCEPFSGFINCVGKVTRQCPLTTIFEEKRKESRSRSSQGPSAYQPSALPLGHTGSQDRRAGELVFLSRGGDEAPVEFFPVMDNAVRPGRHHWVYTPLASTRHQSVYTTAQRYAMKLQPPASAQRPAPERQNRCRRHSEGNR